MRHRPMIAAALGAALLLTPQVEAGSEIEKSRSRELEKASAPEAPAEVRKGPSSRSSTGVDRATDPRADTAGRRLGLGNTPGLSATPRSSEDTSPLDAFDTGLPGRDVKSGDPLATPDIGDPANPAKPGSVLDTPGVGLGSSMPGKSADDVDVEQARGLNVDERQAWTGTSEWNDKQDSDGNQEITGSERYENDDGSVTTVETTHSGGRTTQTVTHTTKDGEKTTETSDDGEPEDTTETQTVPDETDNVPIEELTQEEQWQVIREQQNTLINPVGSGSEHRQAPSEESIQEAQESQLDPYIYPAEEEDAEVEGVTVQIDTGVEVPDAGSFTDPPDEEEPALPATP